MDEMKDKLRQMEDMYQTGKTAPNGPPEGQYLLQIQGARASLSQAGNPMVIFEHLVVDGEFQGEVLFEYVVLNDR
jgi:hypothetical protein